MEHRPDKTLWVLTVDTEVGTVECRLDVTPSARDVMAKSVGYWRTEMMDVLRRTVARRLKMVGVDEMPAYTEPIVEHTTRHPEALERLEGYADWALGIDARYGR